MSLKKYMILPIVIFAVGIAYWFLSYEAAGAVMLVVFAGAMALFGWTLLPTASNVGPTAPVDPHFPQPTRR
jgi:ATP/ADP translocase